MFSNRLPAHRRTARFRQLVGQRRNGSAMTTASQWMPWTRHFRLNLRNPSPPHHSRGGFTLLEAVASITIFAVGIIGLLQLNLAAKASSDKARDTVQVSNYLQEGLEAVRTIRDSAWTNVNTDGAYHLNAVTGSNPPWQLIAGGTETISKYARTVTISPVTRQDNDHSGTLTAGDTIAVSGGTLPDPDTKLITVTVSWRNGSANLTRSMYEYLTNWET